MKEYLVKLNDHNELYHEKFEEMRTYASLNNVPIIKRDSLVLIQSIIKMKKIKNILEVGTAIGYSALSFVCADEGVCVDTIERNKDMYDQAIKNIKLLNKEKQINVFFDDALLIDNNLLKKYDMIFIDAAKAQYVKFFEKFVPLLKEDGIVLTDNIIFHGCVENNENLSKNVRNMVKKIDLYNHYLNTLDDYITYYFDSGDGLSLTMRKR